MLFINVFHKFRDLCFQLLQIGRIGGYQW
jgi:hypothetical protein